MRRPFALLAGALLVGALAAPAALAADGDDGFTIKDPRIKESSGLAASHLHPGVHWTHNDSGYGPQIYAVDGRTGETVATITLSGIGKPRDAEAISIGPGNQIYLGDIGDNLDGSWPYVWIYRLPEPKELKDQTIRATQYVVKYSDGPRNAESMVVHPKTGRVYIIDKKEDGGHLYEGPAELSPSGTNVFRPIAPVDLWATDAALSPDGTHLAVRGYFGGIHYDWNGGRIKRVGQLDVPLQRQGSPSPTAWTAPSCCTAVRDPAARCRCATRRRPTAPPSRRRSRAVRVPPGPVPTGVDASAWAPSPRWPAWWPRCGG